MSAIKSEQARPRTLPQIAADLAPLLVEFLSHPDVPARLYDGLTDLLEKFSQDYSNEVAEIRHNFARWCANAAANPLPDDRHILPLHIRDESTMGDC